MRFSLCYNTLKNDLNYCDIDALKNCACSKQYDQHQQNSTSSFLLKVTCEVILTLSHQPRSSVAVVIMAASPRPILVRAKTYKEGIQNLIINRVLIS